MVNWLKPMTQTFEYYKVDPRTWRDVKKIDNVISSSIDRDSSAGTLGSANIKMSDAIGECYIRIYMITIQNGIREKHPLGTFLVQTPSYSFDGKRRDITMDAYTPLLELKENMPPIGYSILKDQNIMSNAYRILREQMRAPVSEVKADDTLYTNFVANVGDTWMDFIYDLISNAKFTLSLDEKGQVTFAPIQDTASLQPVWTYDDSNSSILYPSISVNHDLFGIPNIVEVIFSNGAGYYYGRAVNDEPGSPISTVNRGREITHRVVDPDLMGDPTEAQIQMYAERVLREMSSLEYTISYTHGYCPVRIGDCVRLNYSRAGIYGIKAKVIKQSIKCEPGCSVTETAVFSTKLWR